MAKLKDVGAIITNQTKRDIGDQWKSLSNEERQKYKDVVEVAKAKLPKHKDLLPEEPKEVKRKLQNCISLKSIVGIVNNLSADQRSAIEAIGLGGVLQLRCTFLNHALCKWLVGKFDPVSRSLTVHGRTYVVTESHVEECLGINGKGNVIDVESHTKIESCPEVLRNVGFKNGVVQLKDLRQYLDKTSEADDVFKRIFALYILGCFLCPNTKAGVTRSFMKAVSDVGEMGKQNWAQLTLHFLCKGIQYQRDNHMYNQVGAYSCWCVLHQFDKIGGYDNEGVVVHFTEVEEASGKQGGLSQISTADVQTMTSTFVTVAALLLRQYMFMSNLLGTEMKSNPQEQRGEEMDANHVKLFGQASALLKGLQSCQSSPPTAFETHDIAMKESMGLSTNPSLGRHIGFEIPSRGHLEAEMGEEIDLHTGHPFGRSSPQGFRSLAGLSRGRKRKFSIGNPIPSDGGYYNVEVHYEAPRLRQPDQLKKSHFHCSPFTKDGMKKRNPPKKQPANVEDMADDERKPTYEPLTDHEKLFTQFIFDIRDPANGHILDNSNMSECDVKKLCDGYFGDANFTSDIRSCSMIYIPTNDRGTHWFCIKVDIGIRMAYIFDSKPASRSNIARKKLTRAVLEGLHRALVCQYGDLYQDDVTKFNIATVQRQPLQDDTDGYDCGLFVINSCKGLITHQMDDTERPRLLMELCGDENNRDALEVMTKFEAWKARRGECMPIIGRMSYFELRDVISETGCSNLVRVFYQLTATNGEIRLVLIDGDVRLAEMFDLYGREAQIHIYLDDPLWSYDSESDSQTQRGIRSPSGLRTTAQVRRRGGQTTSARGRGRGSGTVRPTGRGGGRGDGYAREAGTGKGQ
ncbi:hypothetical protein RHMOL_Rhmol11G0079300 [Rhododendron molle]|uniref:Uncharacterized protein n=1 Tax=Rhododendron molle TaxID=49168 RepID=A0ACC0LQ57_RHOML|nr:hypothetical protein RHMOL_Rhmol11G0079300 [Rhododendron molle]